MIQIPKLYETEKISTKDKIIYQKWEVKRVRFYWLIAEFDPVENIAYGYANLNDDQMAEWGYISIDELKANDASIDTSFTPTKFSKIMEKQKLISSIRKIIQTNGYIGLALDHEIAVEKLSADFPNCAKSEILDTIKSVENGVV